MFWFGESIMREDQSWRQDSAWEGTPALQRKLQRTSLTHIIDVLDGFGKSLEINEDLIQDLMKESGFSSDEVRSTLSLLPLLLSRDSLEKRLRGEFTQTEILDGFIKVSGFSGRVMARPLGILLHVTAGNVFLSCIDSLVTGLLTKNLSVVKVSSQNTVFPIFFARELLKFDTQKIIADKFSILSWKGGDKEIEDYIKQKVDGIIAWGGEEMISSYQNGLPLGVKFLGFGPKVSFQIITREGLKNKDLKTVAQKVVDDIIPWDQSACSSPQNLFLQEGTENLLPYLNNAFSEAPPRGTLNDDEATEILKEKYRGLYSELMEGGKLFQGESYLIHQERSSTLRPSPLHRTLIVKTFKSEEELSQQLSPLSFYLQSCSYLLGAEEKDRYLTELAMAGIKRFAPLGTITWGMDGAPHDGRMVLRELVQFIGDEYRMVDYQDGPEAILTATEMKSAFETSPHVPGYIFSSGGTTGEPKYARFSYQEFDHVTDMLAQNLRLQGLRQGMVVANLFVAGNLWSSFLAVDRALEKVGVVQLPIGGLCSTENIIQYLKKFRPDAVLGIPSLLVALAENMKTHKISIPMVFYAGEALSQARCEFLRNEWGTNHFGSAGYASVDAGVIGYQCSDCGPGEHHLFNDLVKMEIIEEEAVVSSLFRTTMPIQNYRTGDRVKWIGPCSCGSRDPRFKLLGRIDSLIQIWSCRLRLEDIEKALKTYAPQIKTYQIVLSEDQGNETLSINMEGKISPSEETSLLRGLYQESRDLRDTLTFEEASGCIRLITVDEGRIPRNPRTGKISLILDKRV